MNEQQNPQPSPEPEDFDAKDSGIPESHYLSVPIGSAEVAALSLFEMPFEMANEAMLIDGPTQIIQLAKMFQLAVHPEDLSLIETASLGEMSNGLARWIAASHEDLVEQTIKGRDEIEPRGDIGFGLL